MTTQTDSRTDSGAWQEIVRRHVASMHTGAVEIVIHDGRVVEIKKSERVRFGSGETTNPASGDSNAGAATANDGGRS